MFTCPHCNKALAKSKAFMAFGNKIIQCNHCNALLKPDRAVNQRINIIGGALLAVAAIAGYTIAALPGLAIAVIAGYAVMITVTLKKARFYITE